MSRIDEIFAEHRERGERILMPFLTAGYPTLEATEEAAVGIAEAGAPIIELGFPFSDPIADGPVIAAAMHEALLAGVTPPDVFALGRRVRERVPVGLIAMVSHSIVARIGPAAFVASAAASGFAGLIVPDIDLDAARDLRPRTDAAGLGFSLLVAPTTPPDRLREVAALCTGFVYVLARVGITGEREAAPEIADRVEEVRRLTDLPVAVGFGISTPDHVRAVTRVADAAIVGSALVRRMGDADDPAAAARTFTRQLLTGLAPARA